MHSMSLEHWRRNACLSVNAFAARLGVAPGTYRRALKGQVTVPTMRRIAAALGVPLTAIAEFTPMPSPEVVQHLTAVLDRAEAEGWVEADPVTLEPTGRRVWETLSASG